MKKMTSDAMRDTNGGMKCQYCGMVFSIFQYASHVKSCTFSVLYRRLKEWKE